MAKKTSFGTDFCPFRSNLVPKNFFRGFYLYQMLDIVISYRCMQFQEKLMNQTWKNGKKTFLGPILAHLAQIWAANVFFFKNLAPSVTRNRGQLSSCTISEKTDDPILRKLSDGRKDRRTDGREWFHKTLSDERRASNINNKNRQSTFAITFNANNSF